jgi:TatD DNase family protein
MRELERAVELGCWFSVGPAMLSGEKGRALASQMPRDRVLTESDGPFARLNGASLFPWQPGLAVAELSKLWSVPIETVDQTLVQNLQQLVAFSESP